MYFKPTDAFVAYINQAHHIVLTTHIFPDGDGLGSEIALAEILTALGKKVDIWNCHPVTERFAFIDSRQQITVIPEDQVSTLPEVDLIISVDTSEPSRLGSLEPYIRSTRAKKAACDHHIPPPEHPFEVVWGEEAAGATGLLILSLFDLFNMTPSREAANALFAAIASDTGWFAFNNTTAAELDAASRLVRAGACPSAIHRRIYGNTPLKELTLIGEVMAAARAECQGHFIWSCIRHAQMTEKHISYAELDGMVDKLKFVRHAEIVALIIEQKPGVWKVSLRSPGDCAVNTIARHFKGGGHAKAAGYRVDAQNIEPVLKDLREQVDKILNGIACGKTEPSNRCL